MMRSEDSGLEGVAFEPLILVVLFLDMVDIGVDRFEALRLLKRPVE